MADTIEIGGAVITPAGLATLREWSGPSQDVEEYCDHINYLQDKITRLLITSDIDDDLEIQEIYRSALRLFLNLKDDLSTFIPKKGGEA